MLKVQGLGLQLIGNKIRRCPLEEPATNTREEAGRGNVEVLGHAGRKGLSRCVESNYTRCLPVHENDANPNRTSGVAKVDWRGHI